MQVTVSYKRLETTGSYCNVEVEATAVADLPDKLNLTDEGPRVAGVDALRVALKVDIDRAIAEAKEQKRREEAEDRQATRVLNAVADGKASLARALEVGGTLDCYRLTFDGGCRVIHSMRLSEIAETVIDQAAHNRVVRGLDTPHLLLSDAERILALLQPGGEWSVSGVGTVERVTLGKAEVDAVLQGEDEKDEGAPF